MLAGLAMFTLVSLLTIVETSTAGAFDAGQLSSVSDRWLPFSLLALVFSGLLAFNLAFFRHLRRAYAPPRRSGQGSV